MAEPKNLPIDYRWRPELGVRDRNHVLKNGEYVEIEYEHKEFPKFKYHADYVPVKEEGVEYPFTAHAQLVNSAVEETELGPEWKDFPAEHNIVTAPDAEEVASRQRKSAAAGANWRAAAALPAVTITDHHVAFLRAQGMNISSLPEAYAFLATLSSAQMKSLLDEAEAWSGEAVESGKKVKR
jgi:hypothetical protein